jgi:cyclohexa-1,5-dienecarbonyl-CoA hydratase
MVMTMAVSLDLTRAALVIAHPQGNLITHEIVTELRQALAGVADAPHLKLLTIEGAGADFSFGASVPEHAVGAIDRVLPDMHALIVELLSVPVPTAALVRGRCLGGGFEIALACDFILADDTAVFGLPEIALGVFPPVASVLLPARVGVAAATSAVLTGVTRTAAEWRALGLVELVATSPNLAAEVDAWFGRTLGPRSAAALRHAVEAVRGPLAGRVARELPRVERLYLQELMKTADANEGIRAFMEKRPPRWVDR